MEKNEKTQVQPVTFEEQKAFFEGGSKEIIEILDLVEKRDKLIDEIRLTSGEGKKLEKELEDKKKDIEKEEKDAINNALASELQEENKIIDETNTSIKNIKNKRDKAKEKGVKKRIKEETADLTETNRKLRTHIRKTLKENNLPLFCDSSWFYILYCNQGIAQLFIKLLVFALGFVIIPFVLVKIVNPWFLLKGVLWLVVAAIFFGVYITIYLVSKDKDTGTLEEMREYREKIAVNTKKINKIKRGIRKDKDESKYGLGNFDEELEKLEKTLKSVTEKKNSKIKIFEENSKNNIIEGVREKYKDCIEEKEMEITQRAEICREKTEELKDVEEILKNDYEKFLTKPYLNVGCIRRMLELVEGGNAKNIGEAFDIVK